MKYLIFLTSLNLLAASGSLMVPPDLYELGLVENKGIYERIREGYERVQKGIQSILDVSFMSPKRKFKELLVLEEDPIKHYEQVIQKQSPGKKCGFLNLALHQPEALQEDFEAELERLENLEKSGENLNSQQRYYLELLRTYFSVNSRVFLEKPAMQKQVFVEKIPVFLIPIGPVLQAVYAELQSWNAAHPDHTIDEHMLDSFNKTGPPYLGRMSALLCRTISSKLNLNVGARKITEILDTNRFSATHVFGTMILLDRYFSKSENNYSVEQPDLVLVFLYVSEMVVGKKSSSRTQILEGYRIKEEDFDHILISILSKIGFNFYLPSVQLKSLWVALLKNDQELANQIYDQILFSRPIQLVQSSIYSTDNTNFQKISTGAYGRVYRSNSEVVKVLIPSSQTPVRLKEDFFCEVCLGFGIESPHLARFSNLCYFDEQGVRRIGIVMPYYGQNMRDFLLRSRSQPFHPRKYMRQIFEALECLHEKGWMHGDLKAANIFIDERTGKLRLGDFGLSWLVGHAVMGGRGELQTLHYRAPEIYRNSQDWRRSSDIFAAGVIMAELALGGQEHFFYKSGQDFSTAKENILSCAAYLSGDTNLGSQWAAVFANLKVRLGNPGYRVLLKMLDPNPDTRITASEALHDPYFTAPLPL